MAKSVILSNSNLNVGLDHNGLVSDFYFPDNAYNNHTLGNDLFHRVGVFIDGQISWLNDDSWSIEVRYQDGILVSLTSAVNHDIGIELNFEDAVLAEKDAFIRRVSLTNLRDEARNIKLFFHQNFSIDAGRHLADTVQYIPDKQAILHYRGKRAFVVSASEEVSSSNDYKAFDQHTVGLFGIENKQGSWLDADDGELSNCNVEHGQTDSIIRFNTDILALDTLNFNYWIACADDHNLAFSIHNSLLKDGFKKELSLTKAWWKQWTNKAQKPIEKLDDDFKKLFIESLMLTKTHISKSGAPIASNDSEMLNHARDDYSYCWPRDALYTIWPLIRLGYQDEARKFFEFCEGIIKPEGYFMHKYLPNGELGPSWHPYTQGGDSQNLPVQTDETAGILFLISEFYYKFHDKELLCSQYKTLILPMANFLSSYIDENNLPRPSYELWEMDYLTTTYTTALTFAALNAAADLAQVCADPRSAAKWRRVANDIQQASHKLLYNHECNLFYRGIWPNGQTDSKIDTSSFYGSFMYGLFDPSSDEIKKSMTTLEDTFLTDGNNYGIARFEDDVYYRDNPEQKSNFWIITTLWRAEYYLSIGDINKAKEIFYWVKDRASSTGIVPEQLNPLNLEWRSVAPLTWSQGEILASLMDYISTIE